MKNSSLTKTEENNYKRSGYNQLGINQSLSKLL